jgi:hypothetical protein
MTTWREGIQHFRAWARKGGGIDQDDAMRIAGFYEALARHGGNLDDEMPPELVKQFVRAR